MWAKDRIGTGYRFRNKQRFCWSGRGGRIPAPAPGRQWPSLIEASVCEHSRKPDAIYKLIEAYFSNLPKIELFARHARSGRDRWGAAGDPAHRGRAETLRAGVDLLRAQMIPLQEDSLHQE